MTRGIYKLTFRGTSKVYIGQSENCEERLTTHIRCMKQGTSSVKLTQAFKTFGIPSMVILEGILEENLDSSETAAITLHNSVDTGFNTARVAAGGSGLTGDSHPNSHYSNIEILEALKYILTNPNTTLEEISAKLNISISVISGIFQQTSHKWLATDYPVLWNGLSDLRTLKSRGQFKGASKHQDADIIMLMRILISCPDISYKEIAEFTGITMNTIQALAKGTSYSWVQNFYPQEYSELISLKGSRSRHLASGTKISVDSLGIKYPDIVSPEGLIYHVSNISAFAREHDLDKSTLHKLLNRKERQHKGWKICQEEQVS